MKIYRDGAAIELTHMELMDAANEYRKSLDIEDIRCMADFCETDAEFIESYGISKTTLENIIGECAERYRRYREKHSDYWFYSDAEDAIRDIVIERGLDK